MNGIRARSEYDICTAIVAVKAAMTAKLKSSQKRLSELRAILPDQRAAFVLDEITSKELEEVESEIREHQFFIEMAEQTLEGLSRREKVVRKSEVADPRRAEAQAQCEGLKRKINDTSAYD